MRKIMFIFFFLTLAAAHGQSTLVDKNGTASFYSEAPLENIAATNRQVLGALDTDKGMVQVSMLMKGFRFEKTLMEEHFNENYIESDKYPKATFKGSITDFSADQFRKSGSFEKMVKGDITIHGVTKSIEIPVQFEVTDNNIIAKTTFPLTVADFDIKIPQVVVRNIAEVVEVKSQFNFSK